MYFILPFFLTMINVKYFGGSRREKYLLPSQSKKKFVKRTISFSSLNCKTNR
jgi:hypothetical protein